MAWYDDVLGTISAVAPTLATALGGPLAGMAVRSLESALGVTGTDAVEKAVLSMDPETAAKVRVADQEFAVHMRELDIDLVKINEADRADARKMQVETRSWTPSLLGGGVTIGFFGLLSLMAFHGVPDANRDLVNIMLGALGAGWTAVMSYFFGSSTGSRTKDDTIKVLSAS